MKKEGREEEERGKEKKAEKEEAEGESFSAIMFPMNYTV